MSNDQIDLKTVNDRVVEAMQDVGNVTILLAGRSGAGKSSLVNAVFHGNPAPVGQGRPVTQEVREYAEPTFPLRIIDCRGVELGDPVVTMAQLIGLVRERAARPDPNEHVHVVWYCIDEGPRRIEDVETSLVREFRQAGIPVLAVITKAQMDKDPGTGKSFKELTAALMPGAKNVVRVRAVRVTDDEGATREPMGLNELIAATLQLVPEGRRQAFVSAQKIDIELKKSAAHKAIAVAAVAAGTAGAVPIPFSDAALIVPIQIAMITRISVIFGLPLNTEGLTKIAFGVLTTGGISLVARTIFSGLLKLFPGAGSIAGGALAAGTAVAITTALGEAYLFAIARFAAEHPGDVPSADELIAGIKDYVATKRAG